jgi:type 2 lantibiotic biosynthesis protein LanM
MDQSRFEHPDWYKALTLSERALPLYRSPHALSSAPVDGTLVDEALAERRLARWRGQEPFPEDGFFARRLALDGLTESELRTLLGEPAEGILARETETPAWLIALKEAFTRPAPERFPVAHSEIPTMGFLNVIRPLLDAAFSRLLAGLREIAARYRRHSGAPFEATAAASLLAVNLPSSLLLLLSRTMVLELQLARQQGQLSGETPEERFRSFVARLRNPEIALALLRQYPVVARAVVETLDRWVMVGLELLERLAGDWTDLRALFSPDAEPGALVELRTGLGDFHRGGRTVTLFRFESGLRLIYKPKSLGVEAAFQNLLRWTGQKGFEPGFRTLCLLDRGMYGWVELIEASSCTDEAAVRRFYQRQGGYLALLWLLDATDLHWENLIASGEHPVLVDLETLFVPRQRELGIMADEERVGRVLEKTVLATGLLPSRVWADRGGEGVDLSGLAGTGGQAAPSMLRAEHPGTDEMRFELLPVEIPAGDNLPTLNGATAGVSQYMDEVVDGFTRMARLFLEHRQEMAAPGGPLDAFADTEVRIIVRPTRNYGLLFFESFHAYAVGDALDRDRMLDRLWLSAREHPVTERVVSAERRDLLRGDIPMFTSRPGTRDMWSSDGERYADVQPDSGLERVLRRLQRLDEAELALQAWLVHNSLASIELGQGRHAQYDFGEADPPSREDLLAAAVEVGERLSAIALRGPRDAHWFAAQMTGSSRKWTLQPARLDLHLGLPGIILFLAWLGELTGETRFTDLARAALVTLRDQIAQGREIPSNIGAYAGWGGLVWVLTHLGVLWGDEELLAEAERIAHEEIPPGIPADESNDLIAGASGSLIALLTLHEVRPSDRLLATAVQCGERLLARARPMERGLGWDLKVAGPTPLAGLSHGVAGIAWPLLRLAAKTGDRRFRETALAALEYERSLYNPEKRNWPDLREGAILEDATEPYFMWAWCHGAPGVGLGRLAGLPYLDDVSVREEIEIAVASTIENGFGRSHCLCHGDLGNLEVVTLAAERLGRPDWALRAGRIAGGILAGIRESGWLFGLPGRAEPPGMMLGLAGIGYGLLRLAAPERVPSVLILENVERARK